MASTLSPATNRLFAVTGTFSARTPFHIGTGGGRDATDAVCRRDADGHPMIPATAIGGNLRAIATRIAPRMFGDVCVNLLSESQRRQRKRRLPQREDSPCGCSVCHLFGDLIPAEPQRRRRADTEPGPVARASRIIISHARLAQDQSVGSRIQDGVGIDRATGTAARAGAVKFDLEVLPPNTLFEMLLELEEADERDLNLLAVALSEWQAGRCRLGGRTTRGLGNFEVVDLQWWKRDLSEFDSLVDFLQTDRIWPGGIEVTAEAAQRLEQVVSTLISVRDVVPPPGINATPHVPADAGFARSFLQFEFDLIFESPFTTNDAVVAAQAGVDFAPLVEIVDDRAACAILAGSSLRGVVRSHAERIARTIATHSAFDSLYSTVDRSDKRAVRQAKEAFLRMRIACNPVESRADAPLASCDAMIRNWDKKHGGQSDDEEQRDREVELQELCLACQLFGSTRHGSRFAVADAISPDNTFRVGKLQDFLGIDRFTGGGVEHLKFDGVVLNCPRFPGVQLFLENPNVWEVGWLLLVLRDLAAGFATVGFGRAKGFGRTRIDSITLQHGFLLESDILSGATPPTAVNRSGLYQLVDWTWKPAAAGGDDFTNIAQIWIDEFLQRLRPDEVPQQAEPWVWERDTFFDAVGDAELSAFELYGPATTEGP